MYDELINLDDLVDDCAEDILGKLSPLDLGDIAHELRDVLIPLMFRTNTEALGAAFKAGVWAYCRRVACRNLDLEPLASDDSVLCAKEAVK